MREILFDEYIAPDMEVAEVCVEVGFSLSSLEDIYGENEDLDW